MEHEDPLAPVELDESSRQPGSDGRSSLVRHEPARGVEQPGPHELGRRIDEARAANAERLGVPDDLELQRVVGDADDLDRPVRGPHPAADLCRLERRARRRCRANQPLGRAERDLAVGAHVDEQPQALVTIHAGGEQSRDDVTADVRAEGGKDICPGEGMEAEAGLGGRQVGVRPRGHDERRDAEGLGVDAEGQRGHGRVPRERDLVDLFRLDVSLAADFLGELLKGLAGQPAEALQRVGVEHRARDARDDVGAERLLTVEHRSHRHRRARRQVEQRGDRGRRPEVERDRMEALGRVARLDVDQELVGHDARHLVRRLAKHLRQAAEHTRLDVQLEVVQGVAQPLEIGPLIGERRLVDLHVPLLQPGPQDHLPSDPDRCRLRPRDERRDVDDEVAVGVEIGRPGASRVRAPPRRTPSCRAPSQAPARRRSGSGISCRCRARRRSSRWRCRSTRPRRTPSRPPEPGTAVPEGRKLSATRPGCWGAASGLSIVALTPVRPVPVDGPRSSSCPTRRGRRECPPRGRRRSLPRCGRP